MNQHVTLSRAARLVGVSRAALQKKIRNGELTTFEGKIEVAELLRVFPQTRMEEDAMLERAQLIMEQAINKVIWKSTEVPDVEILAERVSTLNSELARAKAAMNRQTAFVDEIEQKLSELAQQGPAESRLKELRSWFVESRRERMQPIDLPEHFTARDAFLRIIAADVKVLPSGHEFLVEGRNSLLESALFSGCNLSYGCSDGSCGLCKARLVSGKIKEIHTPNFRLSKAERSTGEFLLCCNTAVTDLVIEAQEAEAADAIPLQKISARVKVVEKASDTIWMVHLRTPRNKRLRFLAGQYATLHVGDQPAFDVPIASCPCHETHLEFHVSVDNGHNPPALFAEAKKNTDPVIIEGPKGNFILDEGSHKPIIFIAWDRGFAPMKSLIEHAIALDITESMHLYWITTGPDGHYMQNLCRSWADALDYFKFTPIAAGAGGRGTNANWANLPVDLIESQLMRVVLDYPHLKEFNIYIVGPEKVVAAANNFFANLGIPDFQLFSEQLL